MYLKSLISNQRLNRITSLQFQQQISKITIHFVDEATSTLFLGFLWHNLTPNISIIWHVRKLKFVSYQTHSKEAVVTRKA